MCMVSAANKAVDFGSVKSVQWSDGVEDGASIEAIYGNGELCNNGIPRKTIVEYVCNLNQVANSQAIKSVSMIDECTAKMIIESAYACPVNKYCASISTSESCSNQEKLCRWSSGKCEAATGCGWRRLTDGESGGLVLIVLVTLIGAAVACTCGLCVCCCVRKRRARKGRKCMMMRRCSRKNGKTPSKKRAAKKQEQQEVEYAPFQMPLQLIPGGFAPINPYSNIQGYPMVTLVAPGGEEEQV